MFVNFYLIFLKFIVYEKGIVASLPNRLKGFKYLDLTKTMGNREEIYSILSQLKKEKLKGIKLRKSYSVSKEVYPLKLESLSKIQELEIKTGVDPDIKELKELTTLILSDFKNGLLKTKFIPPNVQNLYIDKINILREVNLKDLFAKKYTDDIELNIVSFNVYLF